MSDVAVVSEGAKSFAKSMISLLKERYDVSFHDYREKQYKDIDFAHIKAVWNIGLFYNVDEFFRLVRRSHPKVKMINHWTGSDILQMAMKSIQYKSCVECIFKTLDIHSATAEGYRQELLDVFQDYVSANDVFTICMIPPRKLSLTQHHNSVTKILIYGHNFPFVPLQYQIPAALKVAKRLPDVEFYVIGFNWDKEPKNDIPKELQGLPNVKWVKFIEDEEEKYKFFGDMSGLVSFSLHHPYGQPPGVTAIEFLQMGKWVLSNPQSAEFTIPHTLPVDSSPDENGVLQVKEESVEEAIKKIVEYDRLGSVNVEGSKHYLEHYNRDVFLAQAKEVLERVGVR